MLAIIRCRTFRLPVCYLKIYLLNTYSVEQIPSWEADRFLVKKFPNFYGTRKFITAFTSALYLSLFWNRANQFLPLRPTSWRSHFNIIYPSTRKSSNWSLSSVLSTKTLYESLLSPNVPHAPPISFFRVIKSRRMTWVEHVDGSSRSGIGG